MLIVIACMLAALLAIVVVLACLVGMTPPEEMRAYRKEFYRQIYGKK